jgi:diguanylate cyclase (GGDEF)-like protein
MTWVRRPGRRSTSSPTTATWRSIVLPTFGLIVGVGAVALSVSEITQHRRDQSVLAHEADTFVGLSSALELQRTIAQVYIANWHRTLGNQPAPGPDVKDLAPALQRFRRSLGTQEVALTDRITASSALVKSIEGATESKALLGLLGRLGNEATAIGADLAEHGGPSALTATKLLDVPLRLVDLDTSVTVERMTGGVDPMTTVSDLRAFVTGVKAGQGAPDPDVTTLGAALSAGLEVTSPLARALRQLDGAALVRPLATEVAWMLGGGGTGSDHPVFTRYSAATRRTMDRVTALVGTELDRERRQLRAEERSVSVARRQHEFLAAGALGLALVALFALLSRVRRTISALRAVSENDPVTLLLNRTGLRARVSSWFAARDDATLATAVIDLDHFKSVNDTFGHVAGDAMLREVATRITGEVVASSTAVARWGGDEFVMVFRLGSSSAVEAVHAVNAVCDRVRAALNLPFLFEQTPLAITASIGASVCTCQACDLDDLFRRADHLLLDIKRERRDALDVRECGRQPAPVLSATGGPGRRSGGDRRSNEPRDRRGRNLDAQ